VGAPCGAGSRWAQCPGVIPRSETQSASRPRLTPLPRIQGAVFDFLPLTGVNSRLVIERRSLMAGSQEALDRFERQTAWPMMILALAIIPLLVAPLLVDLPSGAETTLSALDWLIWIAFVLEYGIRLYLAPNKRHFVSHNVIDLVFVLIPFLRPLRILRSARSFALLRATRGAVVLLRAVDAVQDVLKRHKLGYTLLVAAVVVVGSGLAVATIEAADPARNIQSIPDGLWWAVTTITTVGYGDRFPVTPIGRAIPAGVMILGIGLFGLLAASLASLLIQKDIERELDPQMDRIEERLTRIESLLEGLQPSSDGEREQPTAEEPVDHVKD
jgi:voltage-gated potassium channel